MSKDDLDTPFTPAEEEVAKEFLTKGLERYAGIATPEMLGIMAKVGIDGLRTHPAFRRMVRRLASSPKIDVSGNRQKGGDGSSGTGDGETGGGDA